MRRSAAPQESPLTHPPSASSPPSSLRAGARPPPRLTSRRSHARCRPAAPRRGRVLHAEGIFGRGAVDGPLQAAGSRAQRSARLEGPRGASSRSGLLGPGGGDAGQVGRALPGDGLRVLRARQARRAAGKPADGPGRGGVALRADPHDNCPARNFREHATHFQVQFGRRIHKATLCRAARYLLLMRRQRVQHVRPAAT